jgi:pantoate kinase
MIREKKEKSGPIVIDLTGPDGNAYALMAYAKRFARELGLDSEEIISNMMSGDYENLLQVFDENFGSFVILER